MIRDDIKVAVFLVFRYIRGANHWTTALIIFVMFLTFLNLTVIGGLLEGIIVGSFNGLRDNALGDIFISSKDGSIVVERTQHIIPIVLGDSRVKALSPRYQTSASIIEENDFRSITNSDKKRKELSSIAYGIDPMRENEVTNIASKIVEGEYLRKDDRNGVLIGRALVKRYSPFGNDVLDIAPGDVVYIRLGTSEQSFKKYTVRGIFRTKAGELDLTVLLNESQVKFAVPNPGNNVAEIAVRLNDEKDAEALRDDLLGQGLGSLAKVQTVEDAIGSFLGDIRVTFKLLGTVVGTIGLIVASITIFIIIFVTAASRQRFIGILKGIGVSPNAIRISYVMYAFFYAICGTVLGFILLQTFLRPYFLKNPLDFPFSDGILYITTGSLTVNIILIFIATFFAGLIPAYLIVKKEAIQAIMNR